MHLGLSLGVSRSSGESFALPGSGPPVQVLKASGAVLTQKSGSLSFTRSGTGWIVQPDYRSLAANAVRVGGGEFRSEAAATNQLLQTEGLTTGDWSAGFRVNRTSGEAVSGVGTFTKVEASETNANGGAAVQNAGFSAGTFVLSTFAVADPTSPGWVLLMVSDNAAFGKRAEAWFNPSTGAAGTVQTAGTGFSAATSGVEDIGGGVYRFWLRFTVASALTLSRRIYVVDGNASRAVTIGKALQVWGANFTDDDLFSYIPSTTTNTTRNVETATTTMLHGGGALSGYLEFRVHAAPADNARLCNAVVAATGGDDRQEFYFLSGNLRFSSFAGGTARGGVVGNLGAVGAGTHKLAFSISDSEMIASIDGGSAVTIGSLTGTLPAVDLFQFFTSGGASQMPSGINGVRDFRLFAGAQTGANLEAWSS